MRMDMGTPMVGRGSAQASDQSREASAPAPEFSRPVTVASIGVQPRTVAISASRAECEALAERFGIVGIDKLEAEVTLRLIRGGRYVSFGARMSAVAVQSCVVTLEPIAASVSDRFDLLFGPLEGAELVEREIDLTLAEEAPEPIERGEIDIGEAIAQQLSLLIDPYPRQEGADPLALDTRHDHLCAQEPEPDESDRPNPFLALARLKQRG